MRITTFLLTATGVSASANSTVATTTSILVNPVVASAGMPHNITLAPNVSIIAVTSEPSSNSAAVPTGWSNSSAAAATTVVYSTFTPSSNNPSGPTAGASTTAKLSAGDRSTVKNSMLGLVVFSIMGAVLI